jgi:chromosome segregation ATPase
LGAEGRHVRALRDTVDSLSGQLEASDSRQGRFETALQRCEEHHETCREDLRKTNERLDSAEAEISRLMGDQVPAYAPSDLRRVPVATKARARKPSPRKSRAPK